MCSKRKLTYNEPYNPKKNNTGCANLVAFVDRLPQWDETTTTREYKLPSGEQVRWVTQKKIFGEGHEFTLESIYVNDAAFSQKCKLRKDRCCSSADYDTNVTFSKEKKLELGLKMAEYRNAQERKGHLLEWDEMLSEKYIFPRQATENSIQVYVDGMVSFGDNYGARRKLPLPRAPSTVRMFKPGYYHATVIKPTKECNRIMLYHHEKVDPKKLMMKIILMASDYAEHWHGQGPLDKRGYATGPDVENCIRRYDWGCWNEVDDLSDADGFDDEFFANRPSPTYFCATESSHLLRKAVADKTFVQSEVISELRGLLDKESKCFAFADNLRPGSDWRYGRLFQDSSSGEYFALVIHYVMGVLEYLPQEVKTKHKNVQFTSIKETKLMFDFEDFLLPE